MLSTHFIHEDTETSKMISDFIQFSFYCKLPCQNKDPTHCCMYVPCHFYLYIFHLIFHISFSPSNDWLSFEHKINCHRFFPNNPWECISVFMPELPESKPPESEEGPTYLWKNAHLWVQKNIDYLGCTWIKTFSFTFQQCVLGLYSLSVVLNVAFTVKCCWDDCPSPFVFP